MENNQSPVEKLISNSGSIENYEMVENPINSEEVARQQLLFVIKYLNDVRGMQISDVHISYNHDEKEEMSVNYTYVRI